jgi:ribosomal protein S18 acetylase RimI-like enzyme
VTPGIRRGGKDDAVDARIVALLDAASETSGHPFVVEHLTLESWDGDTYLGGLSARIVQGWMYVALLAVAPEARGTGLGRRLMAEAEAEAAARGLTGVWLDTFSFQAPGFYERLGYRVFGTLEDSPPGERRHFFAKRLDGGPTA